MFQNLVVSRLYRWDWGVIKMHGNVYVIWDTTTITNGLVPSESTMTTDLEIVGDRRKIKKKLKFPLIGKYQWWSVKTNVEQSYEN